MSKKTHFGCQQAERQQIYGNYHRNEPLHFHVLLSANIGKYDWLFVCNQKVFYTRPCWLSGNQFVDIDLHLIFFMTQELDSYEVGMVCGVFRL